LPQAENRLAQIHPHLAHRFLQKPFEDGGQPWVRNGDAGEESSAGDEAFCYMPVQ
jgi:hypothetical protein